MDRVKVNMKGFIDDEPIFSFSLQHDFGGELPEEGDYIKLPISTNTYELEQFKITRRLIHPNQGWTLEIEPTSEEGWAYRRRLVESLYQGGN